MFRFLCCCFYLLFNCSRLSAAIVVVTAGDGGNFFFPAYFVINPVDTVKWVWKDGHHNTSSYSVPSGGSHWYANLNSTETEYTFVPVVSGLYKYTCTHHSAMDGSFFVNGCSFPRKPFVTGVWESSPCAGGATIVLRTAPQAGATYQWIKGGTLVPGAITDSLKTSDPGTYTVFVNRCGMDSSSLPYAVPAYPLPVPSFSFVSSGLLYTFTNTTALLPATSFRWDFGDGTPGFTGTDAIHTYSISGSYDVILHISDSSGYCMDNVTQRINPDLGINSIKADLATLYPNPASTFIEVCFAEQFTAFLYDLYGNIVLISTQPSKQHHFNLQGLPAGSYLLTGYGRKEELFRKRIIVY